MMNFRKTILKSVRGLAKIGPEKILDKRIIVSIAGPRNVLVFPIQMEKLKIIADFRVTTVDFLILNL